MFTYLSSSSSWTRTFSSNFGLTISRYWHCKLKIMNGKWLGQIFEFCRSFFGILYSFYSILYSFPIPNIFCICTSSGGYLLNNAIVELFFPDINWRVLLLELEIFLVDSSLSQSSLLKKKDQKILYVRWEVPPYLLDNSEEIRGTTKRGGRLHLLSPLRLLLLPKHI